MVARIDPGCEDVRSDWHTVLQHKARNLLWRCAGRLIQGSPPEPCEDVPAQLPFPPPPFACMSAPKSRDFASETKNYQYQY